jgi:hypothetical protein
LTTALELKPKRVVFPIAGKGGVGKTTVMASQLHLALTDTYIKYALTALPEVPGSLLAAARIRATRIYEQVNLTAAREFQRRRQSDAYNPAQLGIEDEPSYSATPSDEV